MRDWNTDSHNSVSTTPSEELQSHCSTTDVLLPASRAFKNLWKAKSKMVTEPFESRSSDPSFLRILLTVSELGRQGRVIGNQYRAITSRWEGRAVILSSVGSYPALMRNRKLIVNLSLFIITNIRCQNCQLMNMSVRIEVKCGRSRFFRNDMLHSLSRDWFYWQMGVWTWPWLKVIFILLKAHSSAVKFNYRHRCSAQTERTMWPYEWACYVPYLKLFHFLFRLSWWHWSVEGHWIQKFLIWKFKVQL